MTASISITWSESLSGTSITTLDHGAGPNGTTFTEKEVFFRVENNVSSITDCKLYIAALTSGYTGAATANEDYDELIAWGDASASTDFGGVFVNMNAIGGYPEADWATFTSKSKTYSFVANSTQGGNLAEAVTISSQAIGDGSGIDGTVAAGAPENVRFKVRIVIPNSESTTGIRQIAFGLKYTSTT